MIKWMRRIFWAAVGAAVSYYLDPDNGPSRRAALGNQWTARVRDLTRTMERPARFRAGPDRGVVHEVVPEELVHEMGG